MFKDYFPKESFLTESPKEERNRNELGKNRFHEEKWK